jgi:hypothetical protein
MLQTSSDLQKGGTLKDILHRILAGRADAATLLMSALALVWPIERLWIPPQNTGLEQLWALLLPSLMVLAAFVVAAPKR